MKIVIASLNMIKILAVQDVMLEYDLFNAVQIESVDASSEIGNQPMTLAATITGAKNRAKNAYAACPHCNYSIGLESGLCTLDEQNYYCVAICALYDGEQYRIGTSCMMPIPGAIVTIIKQENIELAAAAYKAGLSSSPVANRDPQELGILHYLSQGVISRKDHLKQAIISALVPLLNTTWF